MYKLGIHCRRWRHCDVTFENVCKWGPPERIQPYFTA